MREMNESKQQSISQEGRFRYEFNNQEKFKKSMERQECKNSVGSIGMVAKKTKQETARTGQVDF